MNIGANEKAYIDIHISSLLTTIINKIKQNK